MKFDPNKKGYKEGIREHKSLKNKPVSMNFFFVPCKPPPFGGKKKAPLQHSAERGHPKNRFKPFLVAQVGARAFYPLPAGQVPGRLDGPAPGGHLLLD